MLRSNSKPSRATIYCLYEVTVKLIAEELQLIKPAPAVRIGGYHHAMAWSVIIVFNVWADSIQRRASLILLAPLTWQRQPQTSYRDQAEDDLDYWQY